MVPGNGVCQLVHVFVSSISGLARPILTRPTSINAYHLEVASENIVRKLGRDSLGALLKQEISFSDQAAAGALTSALSSHPANVGAATGLVSAQVLVLSVNLFASMFAGLVLDWRMAIVCIPSLFVLFFSVCYQRYSHFDTELTDDES